MKKRMQKSVVFAVLVAFLLVNASCAYILKPEQRGNAQGEIDTTNLVFDCLWLIAGIIPGVVALAVDFADGAIYKGGGKKSAYLVPDEGRIDVHLPATMPAGSWDLRLVAPDGEIVASEGITLDGKGDSEILLGIDMSQASDYVKKHGTSSAMWTMQLVSDDGVVSDFPLQIEHM